MQCNDHGGNTQCQQKTQHDKYITEIFTYTTLALIYSVSKCVLKCPLLLYKPHLCSSTSWQSDRYWLFPLGSCSRLILQTTFSSSWDKASHWFLREKAHYRLSFISAVLGQFKPTPRTHFGSITEVMIDGKVWMGSSTLRGNTKMSVDFIITKLCFYKSLNYCPAYVYWSNKLTSSLQFLFLLMILLTCRSTLLDLRSFLSSLLNTDAHFNQKFNLLFDLFDPPMCPVSPSVNLALVTFC